MQTMDGVNPREDMGRISRETPKANIKLVRVHMKKIRDK
jgi:hypothetical protein